MTARSIWGFFIPLLFFACAKRSQHELVSVTRLAHYPSASALEFADKKLYVIGDDATRLLVMDTSFNVVDSIALYPHSASRIPKETKADLEAAAFIELKKRRLLLLLGSGSAGPRESGWLIDPVSLKKDSISLSRFYARLREEGLREVNIEGCAPIPGFLFLINRGHKAYPTNYLIKTKNAFWSDTNNVAIDLIRIGTNTDTASFRGVSGMDYAPVSDRLILTVSTEDTRSVYEDGAIGKSYLWIVKFISSKRDWLAINPDQVIDLEEIDGIFRGQKLESVAVVQETKEHLLLALAADNDDGSSTLFNLRIRKE